MPKSYFLLVAPGVFSLKEILFNLKKPYNNWLESAREDLMDMFSVHTLEEITVSRGHCFLQVI